MASAKLSAGILMFRRRNGTLEVLLAHHGGPFWADKDAGAWTIPKGQPDASEDLLKTAQREFAEEIGFTPQGAFIPLSPVRQKSGKIVHAWAVEGDFDTTTAKSNTCWIEWPPKSGRQMEIPEIDRAEFFDIPTARRKINPAQAPMLDELAAKLK